MTEESPAGRDDRRVPAILSWLVLVAAFGITLIGQIDTINFTVDDSFVSLRYAENAAAGKGLVFNSGERVEGYTNLLWTLLLTVAAGAGVNQQQSDYALLAVAKKLGFVLGFATLALLAFGVWRIQRRRPWAGASPLLSLAVLCVAATYSFPLWNMSGLETPLAAFLVTLSGLLMFEGLGGHGEAGRISRPLVLLGGVGFGLATLVRPEQIFIALLAFGAMWVFSPRRRPVILMAALAVAAIFAAVTIWRWGYYHALLPNSMIAKTGGGPVTALLGIKYALGGFIGCVGFVALGFLGLPKLLEQGDGWRFLAMYCGAYTVFLLLSGGDWMPGFRFHVPMLPLLWLLAIASLLTFTTAARPALSRPALAVLVAVLAIGSFASGRALARSQIVFPTGLKGITWSSSPARVALAKELRALIPRDALLALFEAGYVPYFNPQLRILDTSGLMDPVIARLPGRHMTKFSSDYFLQRQPDYFLTMTTQRTPSADAIALQQSEEFRREYERVRTFSTMDDSTGGQQAESDRTFVLYRRRP